ncbi:hypothetical protein KFL_009410030, partial [Klebsormidium nitens]
MDSARPTDHEGRGWPRVQAKVELSLVPLEEASRLLCTACYDNERNASRYPAKSCEACGKESSSRWHPGANPDAKLCHACYGKKQKKEPPLKVDMVEEDGKTVGYARPNPLSAVRRSAAAVRASVNEVQDAAEALGISSGAANLLGGSGEAEEPEAPGPPSEDAGTFPGASNLLVGADEAAGDGTTEPPGDAATLLALPTLGDQSVTAPQGVQEMAGGVEKAGEGELQKEADLIILGDSSPAAGRATEPAVGVLELAGKRQTRQSSQGEAGGASPRTRAKPSASAGGKRSLRSSMEGAAEASAEEDGPKRKRSLREIHQGSPKRAPPKVPAVTARLRTDFWLRAKLAAAHRP